jgi:hypothetical protein
MDTILPETVEYICHNLPIYLFMTHSQYYRPAYVFTVTSHLRTFLPKFCQNFSDPGACYMLRPPHLPRFVQPNSTN